MNLANFQRWWVGGLFLLLGSRVALAQSGIFEFGARPLGTDANRQMASYLATSGAHMGYEVIRLPFKCQRWEKGMTLVQRGETKVEAFPGPFSPAFDQWCEAVAVASTQQFKRTFCKEKIVFMRGHIAREPLMPKDYPFYFPDEHSEVYSLLSERVPAAVVAITGKHPSSGQSPFPLFEDAGLKIPTAYMTAESFALLMGEKGKIRLRIDSKTFPETGEQVVFRKKAKGESLGKILIFAHMDTAYDTPGALDNAAGVAILLATMSRLKDYAGPYDLEFVPFNGEDSPMVKGQLAYLEKFGNEVDQILLGINIDAAGAKGSKTAVSAYNIEEEQLAIWTSLMKEHRSIAWGPTWVESDHSIFVFRGIPCLALTSSTLREHVMTISHTANDTEEQVDKALLADAVNFLVALVNGFDM